ncbi:MAG: hypothetical protein ACYC5N_00675 [Endomicrobiales bacterium]
MHIPDYIKTTVLLIGGLLCTASLHPEVIRKVVERNPGKIIIYYQDGAEIARETIDKDGNLTTTGKVPQEYYSRQNSRKISRTGAYGNNPVKKAIKPLPAVGGGIAITVNPATDLGRFSRSEFVKFKTDKVKEFGQTGIYPASYNPFVPQHKGIYNSVKLGVGWTEFSQFYVCNPYLLIILSKPTHVVAFEEQCGLSEVQFKNRAIEEIYRGEQASQFFEFLAREPELSNAVRLWMVNAQDAELPYIAIDKRKCENIDFSWHNTPDNIANCVYSLKALYHVGSYKLNNISPDCSKAVLKIKELNAYTCIYVKLWANRPSSKEAREDLAYIIKVIP